MSYEHLTLHKIRVLLNDLGSNPVEKRSIATGHAMQILTLTRHSNKSCLRNLKRTTIFRYQTIYIDLRNGYYIKIQQSVAQVVI